VATKNSWQPFNSVRYVAFRALPSILRYLLLCEDRLTGIQEYHLVKEMRNSGVFAMLQGSFSAVTGHKACLERGQLTRKRAAD